MESVSPPQKITELQERIARLQREPTEKTVLEIATIMTEIKSSATCCVA
jgi:hypothetical protein